MRSDQEKLDELHDYFFLDKMTINFEMFALMNNWVIGDVNINLIITKDGDR